MNEVSVKLFVLYFIARCFEVLCVGGFVEYDKLSVPIFTLIKLMDTDQGDVSLGKNIARL